MKLAEAVLVLQESKALANDLAGGLIKPALDFARDQHFQFGSQRYIHEVANYH
jgi:hypothetical protein